MQTPKANDNSANKLKKVTNSISLWGRVVQFTKTKSVINIKRTDLKEKNQVLLFLLHILLLSQMKLIIKRLLLKINLKSILDLNMITKICQNLLGLLITRFGNSLVNKTMTMRTPGIQGRNRIIINIKSKNLIKMSKEREARGGLMR